MPHDDHDLDHDAPQEEGGGVSERIKVVCHGCGARYQVRATKVRGRRFRASCKKCGGIIVAHCANAFTVMPDQGNNRAPVRRSNPVQLDRDDLYQDEEGWYVVIGGKPHGPLTSGQVRDAFDARRINERSYVWRPGDPQWRRLGEVPEFMELTAAEQHTTHYAGVEPQEAPLVLPSPAGEQTTLYQGQPSTEHEEATRFHVRQQPAADQPWTEDPTPYQTDPPPYEAPPQNEAPQNEASPPYEAPPQNEAPQNEAPQNEAPPPYEAPPQNEAPQNEAPPPEPWEQVPVIPPRPALLPSPTGASRSPGRQSLLPVPPSPAINIPPADHTRPLSEQERFQASRAPVIGPSLAPVSPGETFDRPPVPSSVFSQSLKPIGPPGGPALLAPAPEPFWTSGKIAVAAAIGGGLVVAVAVVVVASVVRPRPRPVVVVSSQPAQVVPSPATPSRVPSKAQVPSKVEPGAVTPEKPVVKPPKGPKGPGDRPVKPAKSTRGRQPARLAATHRKPSRRVAPAHRPKKTSSDDVAALLAAADPDPKAKKLTGASPKKKSTALDPDALLAAAQAPKKTGLGRGQIQSAMGRVLPGVQACYTRYQVPGRVSIRFTVRPDGTFDPQLVGGAAGTTTGYCVLHAVQAARFPSFDGKAIRFTYPFDLK